MILLIANEKGGCGKSTLACNLATIRTIRGHDILLVDADKQQTASFWSGVRDAKEALEKVACIQKTGKIHKELLQLAEKYEDLIIDTGGRDSAEVRSAMMVADVLLIPFRPSQFDLWSMEKLEEIVSTAKDINEDMVVLGVLNLTSPNPSVSEASDTQEFMKEYSFMRMLPRDMKDRIIFRKSVREGLSVVECKPQDPKATSEIESLYGEIYG